MKYKFIFWAIIGCFLFSVGCAATPKREVGVKKKTVWERVANFSHELRFKNITPLMDAQVENLMAKGCMPDYEVLDNETAYLYSLIPGGGQLYAGEPKKAVMYILGSILIIPYFVSFEDAQRSVNYKNIEHAIDFCKQKLRLSKKYADHRKKLDIIKKK